MKKSYVVAAVVLLVILGGLGWAGRWWSGVSGKVFVSGAGKPVTNQPPKNPLERNILLLGYGGGTHDGTYLTDSMMLVHLDPSKARAILISIPRDLWVNIPNAATSSNWEKINSAYSDGVETGGVAQGGKMAKDAVSSVLGLSVDNFVALDFNGFVKTIDALGGVDINVQVTFDDPQYPIEGHEDDLCGKDPAELATITATASATTDPETIFPCRYENLHFDAGLTHMDGATALKYVRSRHSLQDGTDFGRAARQRNLMIAVRQKVLAINFLPKAIPLITSLGDDVRTDLSPSDVASLVQSAGTLSKFKISNLALTDENYLNDTFSNDGQAILVPKTGQTDFTEIKNWIADQVNAANPPDPAIVQVENGTTVAGLAQTAVTHLKAKGVQTVAPVNASDQMILQTKMIVYGANVDSQSIAEIKQELGNPTVENAGAATDLKYNVLVVLGLDYSKKLP